MTLITPTSIEKIKELFVKIVLSRTDKVTKVTDGSVLNGIAYGNAKVGQKALKDVALAQSRFVPDTAYGQHLDDIAEMYGISPRFGALGSSTYLRFTADSGTLYQAGVHTFKGSDGVIFDLDANVLVGADGFNYGKISSQTTGSQTNVDALVIDTPSPIPVGHSSVLNEFQAVGGRDIEGDDAFRKRIKEAINALARPTLSYMEQVLLKVNPNVLRVYNYGSNGNGKVVLAVATQDGSNLSGAELISLMDSVRSFLSLSELNPDGIGGEGVELVNVDWEPVDISFRVDLLVGFDVDVVRRNIQIRINNNLDYRTWTPGDKVENDDLLEIAKNTEGVKYVPDEFFFPSQDIEIDVAKIPRIRGFLMLDLDGAIISNGSGTLNPVYYPSVADFSFQATVLANL